MTRVKCAGPDSDALIERIKMYRRDLSNVTNEFVVSCRLTNQVGIVFMTMSFEILLRGKIIVWFLIGEMLHKKCN